MTICIRFGLDSSFLTIIAQRRTIWVDVGHAGDDITPARRPCVTKSHLASVLGSTAKIVDLRYVIYKHRLVL